MASRCSLLLFAGLLPAASASASITNGKAGGLRGQQHKDSPQVQSISGHYFGLHFDESPFAVNPWVTMKSARVVDDLDPTAPYDRLDRTRVSSLTGAAQVEPGKQSTEVGYTQPDFVPPYLHPKPFPQEHVHTKRDGIMIPIEDRMVVAYEDRLRLPNLDASVLNPLGMYPLVAPADKIGSTYPVAGLDKVPAHYDKFFDQTMMREANRMEQKKLTATFNRVDSDDDNAISSTEFDAEVKGRQKKTDEQAQVLWKQYHTSSDPDMTAAEFEKMAKTGFYLGQKFVNRSDISGVLATPQAADLGFWGGGAACPAGKFIKGVQIKVKPNADVGDNTALNCVKFKCDDDSEIQTAEGPDGAWTEWAECLKGQVIYAVSVRIMAYKFGQDNSGINDLMFKCRSAGQEESTTLMFGNNVPQSEQQGYIFVNGVYVKRSLTTVDDKAVVVGQGVPATQGGWSEEITCGSSGGICGAQGRLFNVPGEKDNMGITDFRFFCCSKGKDCSTPCQQPTSTDCRACQAPV